MESTAVCAGPPGKVSSCVINEAWKRPPVTWRHISVPFLAPGDDANRPASPFCGSGSPLALSVQPPLFLWPGQSFLESGVYESRGVHPEVKPGQTDLVFILGELSAKEHFLVQQGRSHRDNILYNYSLRERLSRGVFIDILRQQEMFHAGSGEERASSDRRTRTAGNPIHPACGSCSSQQRLAPVQLRRQKMTT